MTIKNILIIPATLFTSPIMINTRAIKTVTRVALNGSLVSPLPLKRNAFNLLEGKERSPARACRVRGATSIEPMADEKVDAARPMGMIAFPARAISAITSCLDGSRRVSRLAEESSL